MTDRDRKLAGRAAEPREPPRPTVWSRHLRAQLAALERMGHDGERLLAAAKLSRAALDDPDARFPAAAHAAMLRSALERRPLANLALELALHVPIGAYEVVDYLVTSSDTAGEGLARLARYFRLISDALRYQVGEHEGGYRLEITAADGTVAPRFAAEYGVGITLLNLARATAGRFAADYVSLVHADDDRAAFEHRIGCAVRDGQTWNGFAASREAWALPMPQRDATLRAVLERHARDLELQLPEQPAVEADVRRAVLGLLPDGDLRLAGVARRLGLTPRTLQRRLAERGTVFQDLVDGVLRELAERHLRDDRLSIGEVGYLLGYSEPSAFHRAFRRWSGVTPGAYRAARKSGRAP